MARMIHMEHFVIRMGRPKALQPNTKSPTESPLDQQVPPNEIGKLFMRTHSVLAHLDALSSQPPGAYEIEPAVVGARIEAALALDQDMSSYTDHADEGSIYEVVPLGTRQHRSRYPALHSYTDYAYVFPDLQLAGRWTAFWLARLSLLKAMVSCLPCAMQVAPYSAGQLRQRLNRGALALSVVDNICACAPYMLGEIDSSGRIAPDGFGCRAIGAQMLTMGLFTAGLVPIVPVEQKQWIMDRLAYIGHEKGLKQALVLRDQLVAGSRAL
jgi:hypothetical protein